MSKIYRHDPKNPSGKWVEDDSGTEVKRLKEELLRQTTRLTEERDSLVKEMERLTMLANSYRRDAERERQDRDRLRALGETMAKALKEIQAIHHGVQTTKNCALPCVACIAKQALSDWEAGK